MLGKYFKKVGAILLSSTIIFGSISPAFATSLVAAQNAKANAENDLDAINDEIYEIQQKKNVLQSEMDQIDSELVHLLADVAILKEEIASTKEKIVKAEIEYREAKEEEQKQYNAMKVRIQYLYENGNNELSTALLTAEDFSDALNKIELSNNVYDYDREQLETFEKARQKVESTLYALNEERSTLMESEDGLIEQQKSLNEKLAEKKRLSEDFQSQLEDAQSLAEEYKDIIRAQNLVIARYTYASTTSTTAKDSNGNYKIDGSGMGVEVVNYALQFVGNPYVWGGTSLTNGCDCTGFVQSVYKHFGVSLHRTAQELDGYEVSVPQPGDIICYSSHVAIYMGDGKIVHASNQRDGIKISNNYLYRPVENIRRIF